MQTNTILAALVNMTVSWEPTTSLPHTIYCSSQHGLFFAHKTSRFVLGVSASDNPLEMRRIASVCGIGSVDDPLRKRKSISTIYESIPRGVWARKWTLLGVLVNDGETPGRKSPNDGFIAAEPIVFPHSLYGRPIEHIFSQEAQLGILGIRSDTGATETTSVEVHGLDKPADPTFVSLSIPNNTNVGYDGAPVLDERGSLVALVLYDEIMADNSRQLFCILFSKLIAKVGHCIEEYLL